MPVTVGATPTELNFNSSTPAIPSGKQAVTVQVGAPYPDPNVPGALVRDASMYTDDASARPDFVVLSDGAASPSPISDGAGNFIYVALN